MSKILRTAPAIDQVIVADVNAVRLDPADGTTRITVQFNSVAGQLAFTGTDGAPLAVAADVFDVVADSPFEFQVGQPPSRQNAVCFVAVPGGAGTIKIISERA